MDGRLMDDFQFRALNEHTDQSIPFLPYGLPNSFDVVMKQEDGVDAAASRPQKAPMAITDYTGRFRPTAPQSVGSSKPRVSSHLEILEGLSTVHHHISVNLLRFLQVILSSHRPRQLLCRLVSLSLKEEQPMGEILCFKRLIQVED